MGLVLRGTFHDEGRVSSTIDIMRVEKFSISKKLQSGYFLFTSSIILLMLNFYKFRSNDKLNTTHDDFAVDMLRARYEMINGLEFGGHYSRTLGGTHPGPIYDWLLVLSNYIAEIFKLQALEVSFYVLTTFSILIVSLIVKVIWSYLGPSRAKIFLLVFLLWQSVNYNGDTNFGQSGELNFLNGGKLGSPLWPPYLSPYLFLFFLVSLHAYLKVGKKALNYLLPSLILAAQMYLPYLYITIPIYLFLVIFLLIKKEINYRNFGLLLSIFLASPLVYRLISERVSFLKPNQLTMDQMERYFGSNSGWQPSKGSFVFEKLYGLPIIAILILYLGIIVTIRLKSREKSLIFDKKCFHESYLVMLVIILGLLQIYLIYPSQIGIYQFNWVVFYTIFAISISLSLVLTKARLNKIELISQVLIVLILMASLLSTNLLKLEPARSIMSNSESQVAVANFANELKSEGTKNISLTMKSEENYGLSSSLYWEVAPIIWSLEVNGIEACLTQPRDDLSMYVCKDENQKSYIVERVEIGNLQAENSYISLLDSAFYPNTKINIKKLQG